MTVKQLAQMRATVEAATVAREASARRAAVVADEMMEARIRLAHAREALRAGRLPCRAVAKPIGLRTRTTCGQCTAWDMN